MNLTDYFTDDQLLDFLKLGLPKNAYLKPRHVDSIGPTKGILVVDRNQLRYQKIQVYIGHANLRAFRVTSGWCESGSLVEVAVEDLKNKGRIIRKKVLSIETRCAIGAGYPMEYFDIPSELITQNRVYLVGSFEPKVFGNSKPQDNTKYL